MKKIREKEMIVWMLFFCLVLLLPSQILASEKPQFEGNLYAASAVLMDGESGRILYGKEAFREMPMASTTKIMTCILVLETCEEETKSTASQTAVSQPQVKLGMQTGEQFFVRDLLYSLMLESHNDTAVCLAETVAGSVEGFADQMNQKARSIGCENTWFVTPNGLDGENEGGVHHTTAADLARIMRYCVNDSLKSQRFREITATRSWQFSNLAQTTSYSCSNHNALLDQMDGVISGKTGFTGNAGYCYVCAVNRQGKELIVALLACGWPNHKTYKWSDVKALIAFGEEAFVEKEIGIPQGSPDKVEVANGICDYVGIEEKNRPRKTLVGKEETIYCETQLPQQLEAPVLKGSVVGRTIWYLDGKIWTESRIVAREDVLLYDYSYCLQNIYDLFFRQFYENC